MPSYKLNTDKKLSNGLQAPVICRQNVFCSKLRKKRCPQYTQVTDIPDIFLEQLPKINTQY